MRKYFNILSSYIFTNKRGIFVLLLVMMLLDRANTFLRFSILYTDSDQTVLWQVSKDLMNGVFHGPCFYGQSYNPIIEPLFSLPFLRIGMEYSTALPLITTLMSILPFILLSFYLYKRIDPLVGTIPLLVSLLLSVEFEMLTSIPRGFVTGLFFATIGFTSIAFHKSILARLIGGLFLGIGVYANPNSLLLMPLLLPFTLLSKEKLFKLIVPISIGFSIGLSLIIINARYYDLNPDLVLHGSPSLETSFSSFMTVIGSLDNYFNFVTPLFWRGGWLLLSLFIIVGIRTWRKGFKKHSATLFLSFIILIASFFFSKVSDGTNSVFFSGSRMYLAYPTMIIFIMVFFVNTLDEDQKKIFYSSLILLSMISFSIKIVAFDPLLNHALRGSAYSVVQVEKVKELQNTCEDLLRFSENKPDLILANSPNTKDQIITYGCPCMINDFPITFQPLYERRTWLFPHIMDRVYPEVLIFGNRPKNWDEVEIKNLIKTDTTKNWLLIKNHLKTKDLLTEMNIVN
ncbi:MAG: hypothetical protein KJ941_10695 [Bacteroidetes bacterium]|nr:hypothetical protein [Bacteroidota bacterium]